MSPGVPVRLAVREDLLPNRGGEALARHAEAALTALLDGLGVPRPVTVTVGSAPLGGPAVALFRAEEQLGSFHDNDLAALSVLGVRPALGAELIAGIARQLAAADVPRLLAEPLDEVSRHLLDLWIRVPDPAPEGPPEAVVAVVRPVDVRLRLAPDYLRALTLVPHEDAFRTVRWRLGRQLGVTPPRLRLEAAPELTGTLVQPVVNDVVLCPVEGMSADTVLVEATTERLREAGLEAEPVGPDSRLALAPARRRAELAGHTHWTATELVAYWWESFAPTVAWRAFDERDVASLLDRLRPVLPTTVRLAAGLPSPWLTERLRAAYRESSHLVCLPTVLEGLVRS
ncbi:hypothetical protein [Actinophytocola xanthii]|uniref:Uncharacterized protein n=1 Tax=Actinophytocola xanthii TaxID=1912961 RepID=A0A1Q8CV14_9PSEU|nr:hypothetical protein [Actinophytocola xanthii]OLF18198.1 hypothetical protein BU204_07620 [Actinophytocola xanthii]